MRSFFSQKVSPENKKPSLTKGAIYAIAGIYIASSLMGQSSLFFKNALITVGTSKITDADIVRHIHLLALDPKGQEKQKTYGHILQKISQLALLDQEAKKLSMRVSSQSAKESLVKNPLFKDQNTNIKDFLAKHRITLSQAVQYEKRKLTHQRLKKAIQCQTTPIPSNFLALWEKGWSQHRKGIYRAFSITSQDIAAQKVSSEEIAQYLAKKETTPLSPMYRICTVLALDPKEGVTKQYMKDLSEDKPKNLLDWAHKKGLTPHTIQMDVQGKDAEQKTVSLLKMDQYHTTYNDLFFQKEQSALTQKIFDHAIKDIFFHATGQDLMYYIVQVIQETSAQPMSKAASEKWAKKHIQKQKAYALMQKKADAFAKNSSLQGTPIQRFGFNEITVHDIASDDILLYDTRAHTSANKDFPWVAKCLFDLKPGQSVGQSFGIDALDHHTFYVVKVTEIKNESWKNKDMTKQMAQKRAIAKERLQKNWVKRMWVSYLASLEKQYPIQYQYQKIQSFLSRAHGAE
jgi:hypothetical protein